MKQLRQTSANVTCVKAADEHFKDCVWNLDLCRKALALVAETGLSEALGDLCGLFHSEEPVVAVVNVGDRPEITNIQLNFLLLLFSLCSHGGCYGHHCAEDEGRNLQNQRKTVIWKSSTQDLILSTAVGAEHEGTLTTTSSTMTEPVSGWLGWLLVSITTEQGLSTCNQTDHHQHWTADPSQQMEAHAYDWLDWFHLS